MNEISQQNVYQDQFPNLPDTVRQPVFCLNTLNQKEVNAIEDAVELPQERFIKRNLVLYRIEEITFKEDSPRLEALENVLSCISVPGVNVIYLILGDKKTGGVRFYFGFAKDNASLVKANDSIRGLGRAFIRPAIEGNFRGSTLKELDSEEIDHIHKVIEENAYRNSEVLQGVPGLVKDKEKQDYRGIDRLVEVMQGDEFGFMIIAKPISDDRIEELRNDVFKTYSLLVPLTKRSVQHGVNEGRNQGESSNSGWSITEGKTETTGINQGESKTKGTNSSESENGSSYSSSRGKNSSRTISGGKSQSTATNVGSTNSGGKTKSSGTQHGVSITASYELLDKSAENWVKYYDDVLIPRLDYASGKGAYAVSTLLFGENPQVVRKLSNVARSIFSGDTANRCSMHSCVPRKNIPEHFACFSLPFSLVDTEKKEVLPFIHTGNRLGYSEEVFFEQEQKLALYSCNWMSVRELALMAGLPQKEVIGVRLKEEVEFGLNIPYDSNNKDLDTLPLGHLVKSGSECHAIDVGLEKSQLDRHVFVAGVTGSGKTTTCQTLLLSSGWPFLVIEPVKTEYRGLRSSQCPDLLVFTLGDDTIAPFRLNPFEFLPGESITSRVDMLMASITSAFDMEAAIPQLIERAIYACYTDYGWDIGNNQNRYYKEYDLKNPEHYAGTPFEDGVFAFPTLSDVLRKTNAVVNEMNFDERLKKDYIGSINARLQGLTLGAKGFMLDCQRSIDFMKLLDRKVVLELESIPNAAQKSLIIGFILTNLLQAIKKKFNDTNGKKVNHITLIEEAHRLLTKPEAGCSPSQRQATETFADMLAEIRKYGESLIIAEQIPGKLTPEVIKNTNTKIIHRLFAPDDKEVVGRAMDLDEEQADFLSHLDPGRAIVFNGKWPKAVQIQITQLYRTDSEIPPSETNLLREGVMRFYAQTSHRGVFGFSELFLDIPTSAELTKLEKQSRNIKEEFYRFQKNDTVISKGELSTLLELITQIGLERVLNCMFRRAYYSGNNSEIRGLFPDFIKQLLQGASKNEIRPIWNKITCFSIKSLKQSWKK